MTRQSLSDNEMAVLQVLWKAEAPLSRPKILEKIPNNDWNPNSVHLVLNNLIKKGFVNVSGITRCGQSYGRTYYAAKTQAEYAAELALSAMPDVPAEESVVAVMAAMVRGKRITEPTIDKLQQMLDQRREELRRENPAAERN